MQGTLPEFPPDLAALQRGDWLNALRRIGEERGFSEPLGRGHAAIFVEQGDTLLVSFESMPGIATLSETKTPFGFEAVGAFGWSSLSVLSHTDTWFRDPMVYSFFDNLQDDGFFDDFDRVVFFGAGPGGYAAGAFSVAAPGARVLMLQPQATLDPRMTGWDERFMDRRRMDFTSRYGYAPDMMEAAQAGYVLYDPYEYLDAMHAALFKRSAVTLFPLPFMGATLQTDLAAMGALHPILDGVAQDRLDSETVSRLMRARRDHPPYLRRLLGALDSEGRTGLARMLCHNVVERMHAPRFRRRLAQIDAGLPPAE